jgi:hypothetical protein
MKDVRTWNKMWASITRIWMNKPKKKYNYWLHTDYARNTSYYWFFVYKASPYHQHGDIKIRVWAMRTAYRSWSNSNEVWCSNSISAGVAQQILKQEVAVQNFPFDLSPNSTWFDDLANSFMSLWWNHVQRQMKFLQQKTQLWIKKWYWCNDQTN